MADRNLKALDKALQKRIEEKGCTGVAVCIRGPEGVLFEKGYGKRSVKAGLPVLPDTVFGIASLSKSFTALALCILHAEGRLDLDDPAVKNALRGIHEEAAFMKVLGNYNSL